VQRLNLDGSANGASQLLQIAPGASGISALQAVDDGTGNTWIQVSPTIAGPDNFETYETDAVELNAAGALLRTIPVTTKAFFSVPGSLLATGIAYEQNHVYVVGTAQKGYGNTLSSYEHTVLEEFDATTGKLLHAHAYAGVSFTLSQLGVVTGGNLAFTRLVPQRSRTPWTVLTEVTSTTTKMRDVMLSKVESFQTSIAVDGTRVLASAQGVPPHVFDVQLAGRRPTVKTIPEQSTAVAFWSGGILAGGENPIGGTPTSSFDAFDTNDNVVWQGTWPSGSLSTLIVVGNHAVAAGATSAGLFVATYPIPGSS
jgi:hypothetical protein